ncbi:MAG TPA: molybdopterin-dependent oxidoreductase [Terriglobales bacterium]
MRNRRFYPVVLLAVMVLPVLASGQQLAIQDESGKQTILARADLDALPRVKITTGSSSSSATFEGVALDSVMEKAGVGLGETMKGKRMASYLLVEAADGYRVVFALPEIDPAFTDKRVVLAFLKDGKPLDAKEGPYLIVVPDEKRMARWVRQVTTLKMVAAP